jgi:hypothetical protein
MTWMRKASLLLAAVAMPLAAGCNPLALGFLTPIPVQPWTAERIEDKYVHKNDFRTPIMPPIRDGFPPPVCEDLPTDREVLRAMPHVTACRTSTRNFATKSASSASRIVDRIDPPLLRSSAWLQLHHCHWKCTIYYTETVHPITRSRSRSRSAGSRSSTSIRITCTSTSAPTPTCSAASPANIPTIEQDCFF